MRRSSADGVALRYVLPALWMTSFGRNGRDGSKGPRPSAMPINYVAIPVQSLMSINACLECNDDADEGDDLTLR